MKYLFLLKTTISSNEKIPVYAEHSMLVESRKNIPKEKVVQCYNCAISQFKRMHGIYPFMARYHNDNWFNENTGKKYFVDVHAIVSTGNCVSTADIYSRLCNYGSGNDLSNKGYSYLSKLSLDDRIKFLNEIASAYRIEYDIYGNKHDTYYRLNSDYDEWLKYNGVQRYKEGTKLIHNGNGLECIVVKHYEPYTIIGWDARCCEVYYPDLDQYSYEDVTNFTKEEK